jgi:hypothetical protein
VLDEKRCHLIGRVVMNPMGGLRDVDDAYAGNQVGRKIGERCIQVLLLVTPNDERRDFHVGPREPPAKSFRARNHSGRRGMRKKKTYQLFLNCDHLRISRSKPIG